MDKKTLETVVTLTAAVSALPESRRQYLVGYAEGVIAATAPQDSNAGPAEQPPQK